MSPFCTGSARVLAANMEARDVTQHYTALSLHAGLFLEWQELQTSAKRTRMDSEGAPSSRPIKRDLREVSGGASAAFQIKQAVCPCTKG